MRKHGSTARQLPICEPPHSTMQKQGKLPRPTAGASRVAQVINANLMGHGSSPYNYAEIYTFLCNEHGQSIGHSDGYVGRVERPSAYDPKMYAYTLEDLVFSRPNLQSATAHACIARVIMQAGGMTANRFCSSCRTLLDDHSLLSSLLTSRSTLEYSSYCTPTSRPFIAYQQLSNHGDDCRT
jgi:hypothetical protein